MAKYIDREKAILALLEKGQHSKRYKIGKIWELNFDEIREAIKAIPSADVVPRNDYESMKRTVDKLNKALAERKRGMWQIVEKHTEYRTERCSICGFVANRTYIRDIWNFCPNCGADMRGGKDG